MRKKEKEKTVSYTTFR